MKRFLLIVGVFVAGVVLALTYYGLFAPIVIEEKEVGPFVLVYDRHIGDYKQISSIMDNLYERLRKEDSITPARGFGLYYDNPKTTPSNQLRSIGGCIVDNVDRDKIDDLKSKYYVAIFPESKSIVVGFPFKGMVSIFIGITRVYPKLGQYVSEHQYPMVPVMEVYDQPHKKITYIASYELRPDVFDAFLGKPKK